MLYHQRLLQASTTLKPHHTNYRILWQDPDGVDPETLEYDHPVVITCPAPEFMAALMHGGIAPSIEAINAVTYEVMVEGEAPVVCTRPEHNELQRQAKRNGKRFRDRVLDYLPVHMSRIGPLTEEQAMEYLLQKDVPPHVIADNAHNRKHYIITHKRTIPTDRTHRNAWRLA